MNERAIQLINDNINKLSQIEAKILILKYALERERMSDNEIAEMLELDYNKYKEIKEQAERKINGTFRTY